MSASDETRIFAEDFELTDEMLEAVSGGEINVAQEMFLSNFINSTKEKGETLDELIDFVRGFGARKNAADLKGFWAELASATPEKIDEMVEYLKQNW